MTETGQAQPEPPPPHPVAARLGESIDSHEITFGQLAVRVTRDRLLDLCRALRDDATLRFDHLADVTAVDYLTIDPNGPPEGRHNPRFDVVYHLYSISRNQRLRVKVALGEDDASVPSVTSLWPAANWAERETYDMYGITFNGHPELTRILMPDDCQGHPLRKDYPLIEEEIEFSGTLARLNEDRR